MEFFEEIVSFKKQASPWGKSDALILLEDELHEALELYWKTAGRILEGSGTRLYDAPEGYYAFSSNFFSALFLYSYHRAGIDRGRRVLYAALNQCIRGMVTGADNILDDEYKKTLETDLPEEGTRFRSVLDIMVSDRVLFDLLSHAMPGEVKKILGASAVSLRALVRSGAQEAGEETGVGDILSPDEIIRTVHHFKTGLLFQSPWAIPNFMENRLAASASDMSRALYDVGLGCQIMDDMVDLSADLRDRRHNYVVSLICHGFGDAACRRMDAFTAAGIDFQSEDLLSEFPGARAVAETKIREYLERGFGLLFEPRHQFLVEPAIRFLWERIGAALLRN